MARFGGWPFYYGWHRAAAKFLQDDFMENFLCVACGTQYPASSEAPHACAICDDERQFVPPSGQEWTTLAALRAGHQNQFRRLRPDVYAIATQPAFAIGQRAMLIRRPGGNILWDCIALLDDATVDIVRALGGISRIAISHPHYFTTAVAWARAFDCEVWLHADLAKWLMRPDERVRWWSGESVPAGDGIQLIRLGGHFTGATVLHYAPGAQESPLLFSGDILQVTPDRRHVSVMWSYPNYLPLPAREVRRMIARLAPYEYDSVYGAFWQAQIVGGAKAAVALSLDRYLSLLEERGRPAPPDPPC
jgi:hypothetical protein